MAECEEFGFQALIGLPAGEEARKSFEYARRIVNQKFVADDDGPILLGCLENLGFEHDYCGAFFILANLYLEGFPPAIDVNVERAIGLFVVLLSHHHCCSVISEKALVEVVGGQMLLHYDKVQGKESWKKTLEAMVESETNRAKVTAQIHNAGKDGDGGAGETAASTTEIPNIKPLPAELLGYLRYTLEKKVDHKGAGVAGDSSTGTSISSSAKGGQVTEKDTVVPIPDALNPNKVQTEEQMEAERLKEEANELYRMGSVPGNSGGDKLLKEAAHMYCKAYSTYPSYVYLSNASQAHVSCENWAEARDLAEMALDKIREVEMDVETGYLRSVSALEKKSDSYSSDLLKSLKQEKRKRNNVVSLQRQKLYARLARSLVALEEYSEAAEILNTGLTLTKKLESKESSGASSRNPYDTTATSFYKQYWDICLLIPRENLPEGFEWAITTAQLERSHKPSYIDMEKRITGRWAYTIQAPEKMEDHFFEIALVPSGQLVYAEEQVQVELMQDRLLSWHGDFSLVPGMKLEILFDPGMDALDLTFVPPPDDMVEEKMKGKFGKHPQKFTARRISHGPEFMREVDQKMNPQVKQEETKPNDDKYSNGKRKRPAKHFDWDAYETPDPFDHLEHSPKAAASTKKAELPTVPIALTSVKNPELRGKYVYHSLAEGKPCYKHETAELFLWFRSQWGITRTVDANSFRAPFLARSPNASAEGTPASSRPRPTWMVNMAEVKGAPKRGGILAKKIAEEVDPGFKIVNFSGEDVQQWKQDSNAEPTTTQKECAAESVATTTQADSSFSSTASTSAPNREETPLEKPVESPPRDKEPVRQVEETKPADDSPQNIADDSTTAEIAEDSSAEPDTTTVTNATETSAAASARKLQVEEIDSSEEEEEKIQPQKPTIPSFIESFVVTEDSAEVVGRSADLKTCDVEWNEEGLLNITNALGETFTLSLASLMEGGRELQVKWQKKKNCLLFTSKSTW